MIRVFAVSHREYGVCCSRLRRFPRRHTPNCLPTPITLIPKPPNHPEANAETLNASAIRSHPQEIKPKPSHKGAVKRTLKGSLKGSFKGGLKVKGSFKDPLKKGRGLKPQPFCAPSTWHRLEYGDAPTAFPRPQKRTGAEG